MVNSRNKGSRNELKCVKALNSTNLVYRVPASRMWQKQEDIFGLWDIFTIDKEGLAKPRLIQVRTNHTKNISKHKEFAQKYNNMHCEIWVYRDYKELRIIEL